VNNVTEIY